MSSLIDDKIPNEGVFLRSIKKINNKSFNCSFTSSTNNIYKDWSSDILFNQKKLRKTLSDCHILMPKFDAYIYIHNTNSDSSQYPIHEFTLKLNKKKSAKELMTQTPYKSDIINYDEVIDEFLLDIDDGCDDEYDIENCIKNKNNNNITKSLNNFKQSCISDLIKFCKKNVKSHCYNTIFSLQKSIIESEEIDMLNAYNSLNRFLVVVVGNFVFNEYDYFYTILDIDFNNTIDFLLHINQRYNDNSYHNVIHAIDVFYTMHCMIKNNNLEKILSPKQIYILLISSLMHDIEHIGCTNKFLIETEHELYKKFPTDSPLEDLHIHTIKEVLEKSDFKHLIQFKNEKDEYTFNIIPDLIYSTNLANQSKIIRNHIEALLKPDNHEHRINKLMCLLIHAADIGSFTKSFHIHKKWALLINVEMKDNKSKFVEIKIKDFADSQIWFILNLVHPIYNQLDKDKYMTYMEKSLFNIDRNVNIWRSYCKKKF